MPRRAGVGPGEFRVRADAGPRGRAGAAARDRGNPAALRRRPHGATLLRQPTHAVMERLLWRRQSCVQVPDAALLCCPSFPADHRMSGFSVS